MQGETSGTRAPAGPAPRLGCRGGLFVRRLVLYAEAFVVCLLLPLSLPAQPLKSDAGTYEVFVCRGECNGTASENLMASGFLVIEDSVYELAELPSHARKYFEQREFRLTVIRAGRTPNACFVLGREPDATGYVGISPVSVTRWSRLEGGAITLPLFQSPDAGYAVKLHLHEGLLQGSGTSWGAGDWHTSIPDHRIAGRRIGPADRSICIRAAEARAAARP